MALFLYVFLPLGWALTGLLLGAAVSLTLGTEDGKHWGKKVGRWAMGVLPVLYLVLFSVGGGGSAGNGITLFGSTQLFEYLCLPWYIVPSFALYVGIVYVIRDLRQGSRPNQA
jgi:hypothetical protein